MGGRVQDKVVIVTGGAGGIGSAACRAIAAEGGKVLVADYDAAKARAVADGKDIKLGGASPGKLALAAGLCDEILVHVAPYLLGDGVRLFDALPAGIRLDKLSVTDGPFATHMRYRVADRPPH